MGGHQTRTGVLAWNSRILSSGSRDRNILQHDIRVQSDFVSKLVGHKSEVCGLKWSHDDRELASGGNDNQVILSISYSVLCNLCVPYVKSKSWTSLKLIILTLVSTFFGNSYWYGTIIHSNLFWSWLSIQQRLRQLHGLLIRAASLLREVEPQTDALDSGTRQTEIS